MDDDDKFADKYRIDSTRMSGYDYSSDGYYFVTICVKNRECLFGDVLRDDGGICSVVLTPIGKIARDELLKTVAIRKNVRIDIYQIMPNHLHVIFIIDNEHDNSNAPGVSFCRDVARNVSTNPRTARIDIKHASSDERKQWMSDISPAPASLSAIIRAFKSAVTKRCNESGYKFAWQSRFYDHVIRSETSLNKIRQYIITNPPRWEHDRNNPESIWM